MRRGPGRIRPPCASLAEESSDTERARDLHAQGVAAAERALGPGIFAEQAGHFWGIVSTRPYMRARLGLAQCLELLGRHDEARPKPTYYALGSDEEAAIVESLLGDLWRATPEAERWLARHAPAGKSRKPGQSGKRRR